MIVLRALDPFPTRPRLSDVQLILPTDFLFRKILVDYKDLDRDQH